jgi:hypothetical protein
MCCHSYVAAVPEVAEFPAVAAVPEVAEVPAKQK